MLRSYDPQIGRFLQNDPYDQFASGYVGMGNDPGNLTDEDGGCAGCKISATASKQVAGVGYNSVVTFKRVTSTTISFSKVMAEANTGLNVVNAISDATSIANKQTPEKTFKPAAEIRAYEPGPLEKWSKSENVLGKALYDFSDNIYTTVQVFKPSRVKNGVQHLGGGHATTKEIQDASVTFMSAVVSGGASAGYKEAGKVIAEVCLTIIGEGMKRVGMEAAKRPGSVILNNMPKFTGNADQVTSQMMTFNRQWWLTQMRSGRPVLDMGLDGRKIPSIFYQMEQNMMKNYLKLHPNAFQIIK